MKILNHAFIVSMELPKSFCTPPPPSHLSVPELLEVPSTTAISFPLSQRHTASSVSLSLCQLFIIHRYK